MYNSKMGCTKTPKYKKQYMQVYSCICMYMYVNICICMNMQLYVWVCLRTHLMRHFFSVSGLVSNWCAHWTWKLAGGGHKSAEDGPPEDGPKSAASRLICVTHQVCADRDYLQLLANKNQIVVEKHCSGWKQAPGSLQLTVLHQHLGHDLACRLPGSRASW